MTPGISSRRAVLLLGSAVGVAILLLGFLARGVRWRGGAVPYDDARDVEARWGTLIAVANVTMHGRDRGSDRVGFFRAPDGTVWGLPMAPAADGSPALACAPPDLVSAAPTDTLQARIGDIVAAADFATERTGTAFFVHLLIRDSVGGLTWKRVAGREHVSRTATTCREPPRWSGRHRDPLVRYHYFRIARPRPT